MVANTMFRRATSYRVTRLGSRPPTARPSFQASPPSLFLGSDTPIPLYTAHLDLMSGREEPRALVDMPRSMLQHVAAKANAVLSDVHEASSVLDAGCRTHSHTDVSLASCHPGRISFGCMGAKWRAVEGQL